MSKLGKFEAMRHDGARWAFELIQKIGLEEATEEFKRRGIMNAPLNIERSEIKRFEEEYKFNCKRSMSALVCMVLHDEFGFSKVRLERFIERWNLKVDCLEDDMCSWADFAEILKEECDVDIDLPIDYRHKAEVAE